MFKVLRLKQLHLKPLRLKQLHLKPLRLKQLRFKTYLYNTSTVERKLFPNFFHNGI